MGEVYKARKDDDGSLVAIKTIQPRLKVLATDVARFLREARALRKLQHPGIVGYLDMNETLDLLYFVMEYVPGSNLNDLAGHSPGDLRWIPCFDPAKNRGPRSRNLRTFARLSACCSSRLARH